MLTTITPHELTRHLEKEEVLPVYYLYGDETYLIEETIRNIEERVIPSSFKDFNYEIFYGSENGAPEIINAAQTIPVVSQKRLIVVKDANQLSAKDLEQLTSYISDPSPFACLVFIGEKVNPRAKFFINLSKFGAIAQLNHPKDRELPYWIQRLANRFSKKISKDAVAFLMELVGNNLQQIYNETEKVSIFIGEKQTIEIEDLEAVVTDIKVESIFTLIDSVGNKNREKALNLLMKILASGEDHLKILGMIIRQFRLILRAKEMLQKGLTPFEVGDRLGIRKFFLKGFLKQVDQFSFDELKKAFDQFLSTDLALKSSRVAKRLILERLILDLAKIEK
ncbi:MAG: DNA polymerase III subunit delta [Desulfobacteria bacterium]